ncbi:MAG: hypothetical protein ACRELY_29675 [Polyangiaceae bacterium]
MTIDSTSAYALLSALRRSGLPFLLDEFDLIGGDDADLNQLLARVRRASARGYALGFQYALLFSWLVARVGPRLSRSCEVFEAEVAQASNPTAPLVMPRWALATPVKNALQRRMPCDPFVEDDDDVVRAYRGLLAHLAFAETLPPAHQSMEIMNSAIPWRVVALADRLEEESEFGKPSIATRIGILKSKTVGPASPAIEKQWWRALDGSLCIRRHVLSHLNPRDGWSFSRCVDTPWTWDDAREATAGIGLAVMQHMARSLRNNDPPVNMLRDVMGDYETAWLDDQAETP